MEKYWVKLIEYSRRQIISHVHHYLLKNMLCLMDLSMLLMKRYKVWDLYPKVTLKLWLMHLSQYWRIKKLNNFKGFYDIEEYLVCRWVDRTDAIHVLTYFKVNDQFLEIIEKMDTSYSPSECRLFEFNQWN